MLSSYVFVSYGLVVIVLLIGGYAMYKRFKRMPDHQSPADMAAIAQQQARNATVMTSTINGSTTRLLITQSLIQAWRMGDNSTSIAIEADTDAEVLKLRNQRLDMMKTCLEYKVFQENDVDEENIRCTADMNESKYDSIEEDDSDNTQNYIVFPKECPICIDTYNSGEKIAMPVSMSCKHAFHDECITLWLLQHDHCPLCRTTLLMVTPDQ
jgi:hypothetical protein